MTTRLLYLTLSALLLSVLLCTNAAATDVALQGITASRALITVDGGKPHWYSVGETNAGITVQAIDGQRVTVQADGQSQTLIFGDDDGKLTGNTASSDAQRVVLHAGEGGHFFTTGTINGTSVQFVVDTGATLVSMNSADAQRIGIDYMHGEQGMSSTAGGAVHVYRVKLDNVSVGGVTLNNVDGLVQDNNALPFILLGNSFLNRMEIQRDGDTMTLTKRY